MFQNQNIAETVPLPRLILQRGLVNQPKSTCCAAPLTMAAISSSICYLATIKAEGPQTKAVE